MHTSQEMPQPSGDLSIRNCPPRSPTSTAGGACPTSAYIAGFGTPKRPVLAGCCQSTAEPGEAQRVGRHVQQRQERAGLRRAPHVGGRAAGSSARAQGQRGER